jgi:hypothetical protein
LQYNLFRAKDRLTIQEREREEAKARQAEREAARAAEERRRQTLRYSTSTSIKIPALDE